ncbi:hypothetical protein JCM8097_005753 [Rhodosporidiobolus ruineniae]
MYNLFDRLPNELLRLIVLLSIPLNEAVSQHKARRKTLTSLCKTCKTLLRAAQPVLWQIFCASDHPLPLPLLNANPHLAKEVRELYGKMKKPILPVLRTLSCVPNIEAVRIEGGGLMSEFAGLTHLTLLNVDLTAADLSHFLFPNLVTLTLQADFARPKGPIPATHTPVFRPSSFPKLRAVFTRARNGPYASHEILHFGHFPQLDFLQFHVGLRFDLPLDLPFRQYPVLVAFDLLQVESLSMPQFSGFSHFQLDAAVAGVGQRLTSLENEDLLDDLEDFIRSSPSIRSFSLPAEFHPSTPLPANAVFIERRRRRGQLLDALEKRNVKVIWRLNSKEEADDTAVSREFWEFAKELKAEKALEAGEA